MKFSGSCSIAMDGRIETFSGRRINVLDPDPEDIDILDIAHALSNICRFCGHLPIHYSVAQHSWHVAALAVSDDVNLDTALFALLHDAPEAYISDIPSPVKRQLATYQDLDYLLMSRICEKFSINPDHVDLSAVKYYDIQMAYNEAAALQVSRGSWWIGDIERPVVISPWAAADAKRMFRTMFDALTS